MIHVSVVAHVCYFLSNAIEETLKQPPTNKCTGFPVLIKLRGQPCGNAHAGAVDELAQTSRNGKEVFISQVYDDDAFAMAVQNVTPEQVKRNFTHDSSISHEAINFIHNLLPARQLVVRVSDSHMCGHVKAKAA